MRSSRGASYGAGRIARFDGGVRGFFSGATFVEGGAFLLRALEYAADGLVADVEGVGDLPPVERGSNAQDVDHALEGRKGGGELAVCAAAGEAGDDAVSQDYGRAGFEFEDTIVFG